MSLGCSSFSPCVGPDIVKILVIALTKIKHRVLGETVELKF